MIPKTYAVLLRILTYYTSKEMFGSMTTFPTLSNIFLQEGKVKQAKQAVSNFEAEKSRKEYE